MRKSILDISELLFKTINIPYILNEITGKIYRESIPLNDEFENVVILTNGITSERNTGVQTAVAHVNILINDFSNGYPQIARFNEISKKIKETLIAKKSQHGNGFYFNIADETLFKDNEQNQLHYFSIKLIANT